METPLAPRLVWLRRLSLLCVGMTILLMGLGAWVKATGSGLSCPDWPQCYGEWLPPFPSAENGRPYQGEPVSYTQAQILYEWGHRAVVSLLLVPLVALAVLALVAKDANPLVRHLAYSALGLYLFQAFLGAVTVVTGNPAWATTMHLVTATAFLTLLVVAATAARLKPSADPGPEAAAPPRARVVSFVYRDGADGGVAASPATAASPVPAEAEARNG